MDWSDLVQMSDHCGGPNACKNRMYDCSKEDCQQCSAEAEAEENWDDCFNPPVDVETEIPSKEEGKEDESMTS